MGGCFSSGGSYSYEDAGCRRQPRVRPSDEDGMWPYVGERDVDNKATIYIDKFHRYLQSEVPQTPAPSLATATA